MTPVTPPVFVQSFFPLPPSAVVVEEDDVPDDAGAGPEPLLLLPFDESCATVAAAPFPFLA